MGYFLRDTYGRPVMVGELLRIGSHPTNQIILQDPQIAAFHATLSEQQGNLLVRDENSPIGTYVNQKRIQGTVSLHAGDQISIGGSVFMVENSAGQPYIPPASSEAGSGKKKGGGCLIWGVVGVIALLIVCLIVTVGGGYYLYNTNTDVQNLVTESGFLPTPVPQLDANGQAIGPVTLDLQDPALNARFSSSYLFTQEDTNDGYDKNNAPEIYVWLRERMEQDQPEWSNYALTLEKNNGTVIREIESVVLKGKQYNGGTGKKCLVREDSYAGKHVLQEPNMALNGITGRIKRVETGVMTNGVLTDRYELTLAQVGTNSTLELISGNLYRARQGGYLVRIEYSMLIEPQSYGMNMGGEYSADKPAVVTFRIDFTYFPNGTMKVKIPASCASEVQADTGN